MEPAKKTRTSHKKHKKTKSHSSTSQPTWHSNGLNNPEQCHVKRYRAPPHIMTTDLLRNRKFKLWLKGITNELHSLCSQGREAEQDLYLQNIFDSIRTNSGKKDQAFAVLPLRNIHFLEQSGYKIVRKKFQHQLKMLESCDMIQNKPFIKAGFCQKIARVFLRLDQPGSAFEWLHTAQVQLQHAEAGEWTGDLLQSLGTVTTFQYFAQIASPKAAEIRRGAYHYYWKSFDHFSQDVDPCTSLKLIQVLMCMFNALINIYLFKDKHYNTFFQNSVPTDDLETSEKILNEVRARFIALDNQENYYEILMEILVHQAKLMMRKTQQLSCLEDQLHSVSSLILQAQSDLDTFNHMTQCNIYNPADIKVSHSHTLDINGSSSYTMARKGPTSHTVEANDFRSCRTVSNVSNSHMIQQCHMVYYQLQVCIASFIHHLITRHSTKKLQEALDHLQICPILQNILLDSIKYRSDDNVLPKEKEHSKTEAETSPTENNPSSISDLSSGPENMALTEPE